MPGGMTRRALGTVSGIALLVLAVCPAGAATWYVDRGACPGGDGLSWETAHCEIQDAIDAAALEGGGDVWIAEGVYSDGRRSAAGSLIVSENVHVYGGFIAGAATVAERDPENHPTVLDGKTALNGSPAKRVVEMRSSSSLDSVSVTGAVQSGIWMQLAAQVTIRDCLVYENTGSFGAGLQASNSDYLTVASCIFRNNQAIGSAGGAAITQGRHCAVLGCLFEGNVAPGEGGSSLGVDIARDCVWRNNRSTRFFGGATSASGIRVLENCVFEKNTSPNGGAIIYTRSSNFPTTDSYDDLPKIRNCIFTDNTATDGHGGAIWMTFFSGCPQGKGTNGETIGDVCYEPPVISGCVFTRNTAALGGSAVYSQTGKFPMNNCIIWENESPAVLIEGDEAGFDDITYSIVQDCYPGEHTYCLDPKFVDAENNDFRLLPDSPCIDRGRDMRSARYGGTSTDLLGEARGVDLTPCCQGDLSNYDMGAYELQYIDPNYGVSTWYVNAAVAPGGDGTSWETAFANLPEALQAAGSTAKGDEILMATGTYEFYPISAAPLFFPDNVTIRGGYPGEESATTFDLSGAWPVDREACIYPGSNCTFERISFVRAQRIALKSYAENIKIRDCIFTRNLVTCIWFSVSDDVQIERCLFEENQSGIDIVGDNIAINECIFRKNGAVLANKPSLAIRSSNATVSHCLFEQNSWGALGVSSSGRVVVEACEFRDNVAEKGAAILYAPTKSAYLVPDPALKMDYADLPVIRNCLFYGNQATNGNGGAIHLSTMRASGKEQERAAQKNGVDTLCVRYSEFPPAEYLPPVISSCVFYGNSASGTGGAIYSASGTFPGNNLIVWSNSYPSVCLEGADAALDRITYSLLQEMHPGCHSNWGYLQTNKFGVDPMFVNAAAGDFRLLPGSPGIDAGSDTRIARYGSIDRDILGLLRGMDASSGIDGDGSDFDMGAFEYGAIQDADKGIGEGEGEGEGVCEDCGTCAFIVEIIGCDECMLSSWGSAYRSGEVIQISCWFPECLTALPDSTEQTVFDHWGDEIPLSCETTYCTTFGEWPPVAVYRDANTPPSCSNEGEGMAEGEGIGEGEGIDEETQTVCDTHSADQNFDRTLDLDEVLRVIQFYNSNFLYCAAQGEESEDGFLPGLGEAHECRAHTSDYAPQDWTISLDELLRAIQFYNTIEGYHPCPEGEDGYCLGAR